MTATAESARTEDRLERGDASRGPVFIVLGALACSRVLYWFLGLRYDVGFVGSAMQVADYDLLDRSPVTTAWYLHLQPPLFNLFVGLGANLFGSKAGLGFQIVYLAVTVAMLVAFVRFCLDLGIHRWIATGLGVFLGVSPTIAQYEHLLFYSHLEVALLVFAARALQRWVLHHGIGSLIGFSAALSALALGRSLYHPVWFIGLGVLLVVVARGRIPRRALAIAVAVPLVCGLAIGTKNAVVFGWWTTGSLEGINLHRITEPYLTDSERAELVRDGTITDVSTEDFTCREAEEQFDPAGPSSSIPVLDRTRREADERLQNLNQRNNVQCLKKLRAESVQVLLRHPDAYARGVAKAVPLAFISAVPDVRTRPGNQDALEGPGRVEGLLLGSLKAPPSPFDPDYGSFLPLQTTWILALAAILVPLYLAWSVISRRRADPDDDTPTVLAFMLYLTLTGVVLTQLTEVGENSRLIVMAWPMLLAGAGLAATALVQHGESAAPVDGNGGRDHQIALLGEPED